MGQSRWDLRPSYPSRRAWQADGNCLLRRAVDDACTRRKGLVASGRRAGGRGRSGWLRDSPAARRAPTRSFRSAASHLAEPAMIDDLLGPFAAILIAANGDRGRTLLLTSGRLSLAQVKLTVHSDRFPRLRVRYVRRRCSKFITIRAQRQGRPCLGRSPPTIRPLQRRLGRPMKKHSRRDSGPRC